MRFMGILKSPYKHRNDMKMIPYLCEPVEGKKCFVSSLSSVKCD